MREYRVDLSSVDAYRGVVTKWRVDPTLDIGAEIRIDQFSSSSAPLLLSVTPVSSNSLDLRFNEAMLPDGGVFSTFNYFLGGLGRGNANTRPDSISLLSTAGGPVYRLTWNTGSMNGLNAVLQVDNALNARGNSIWNDTELYFTSIPLQELDSDFDNMPDWWEDAYGLNPGNPLDADLDDDLDGNSNLDEYNANTNPKDASSFFRVTSLSIPAADDVQVTWASAAGMAYGIDTSDDLINWYEVPGDPVLSAGSETSAILSPVNDRLFVRIKTRRPNPLLGTP
jgi:hypothetical protein